MTHVHDPINFIWGQLLFVGICRNRITIFVKVREVGWVVGWVRLCTSTSPTKKMAIRWFSASLHIDWLRTNNDNGRTKQVCFFQIPQLSTGVVPKALISIKWGLSCSAFLQNCWYKWRPRMCLGLDLVKFISFISKMAKICLNHKKSLCLFHFLKEKF